MTTTFRELEAFVAVADMGSFDKAAQRLQTSQSAVSRLIKEFEGEFERPLFNRDQRSARLTMEGQEVLALARAILRHRAGMAERFASAELVTPTLRLGVTELVAVSWLPGLVARVRERYPRMHLELDVASSPLLHSRLREGRLDIAIVISVIRSTDMARLPIGSAQMGWYCAPGLHLPETLSPAEFERQTLLIQGSGTSAGSYLTAWFDKHDLRPDNVIHSDSLIALLGFAAAGLGLASLPRAVAHDSVRQGALREIKLTVGAPEFDYIALIRIDGISAFHRAVVQLMRECSDFNTPFQSSRTSTNES